MHEAPKIGYTATAIINHKINTMNFTQKLRKYIGIRTKKIPESRIKTLEKVLGLKLPEEYRFFLLNFGDNTEENGTFLTLEQSLEYQKIRTDISFPFDKKDIQKTIEERIEKKNDNFFLEPEDNEGSTMVIADNGCNELTHIVLAGSLQGTIWISTDRGWTPLLDKKNIPLTFVNWLKENLEDLFGEKITETKNPTKENKLIKTFVLPPPETEKLFLRNEKLKELPKGIETLTHLTTVYLDDNKLQTLPSFFGKLKKIKWLELSKNPIQILPDILLQLPNLQHLDISTTPIKNLPDWFFQLPLTELFANNTNEVDWNQALEKLPPPSSLKILSIQNCQLKKLSPKIVQFTTLTTLYLNDNPLNEIPKELSELSKLELLGLAGAQIKSVPDEIINMPSLKKIVLQGTPNFAKEKKRIQVLRPTLIVI